MYGPADPQLAGLFDFLKPVERALRAPVNAVLNNVVPGGKTIVAAANALKPLISGGKGGSVQSVTPAAVTAGLQTAADAAREQALREQAEQAAMLGYGFRFSPTTLLALGLGAYLLLSPRRRSNPRGRRARRRARR